MWWTAAALAADWPMLQGTEAPGAEPVRPWGFAQVVGEGLIGEEPWGFGVRRARVGLRGVVPATRERVNWLVALELGDNALTRADPVVPTDASVTWSALPGLRLRAGQFKLPLGEEALEMNPLAAQFVNLTQTTGLLAENPVADGAWAGGGSGFRDVGVQAFDTRSAGPGELSYAVVVSNGRMGGLDLDGAKDLTARVTYAPVVWGEPRAVQRDQLGVWVFHTQGRRELDGVGASRVRQGAGLALQRSGWQLRSEVVHAAGMLELGAPAPGEPVEVVPDGRALGGYASVHWGRGPFAGGLRYDELSRGAGAEREVLRTLTADVQVVGAPRARLMADVELRRSAEAPVGERVSVQAVAVF